MKPWREGNSHLIIYKMVNYQVKVRADKNEEEEEEEEVGYEGDTVCENRKDHNEKIMENMTQTKTKKARWFSIC